jgi:hypothetical protein
MTATPHMRDRCVLLLDARNDMKYIRIFIVLLPAILFSMCTTHRNYGKLIIKIKPQSQGIAYFTFDTIRISSELGYYSFIDGYQPRSFYCDSLGNRKEIIDSIPFGKYKISFKNIFNENMSIDYVVKDTLSEITLDFLMFNENEKFELFIDKLKENDSLKIFCRKIFCTAGPVDSYPLVVWKKNNDIYYRLMDTTRIMNHDQINSLRKFEKILSKIGKSNSRSTGYDIYRMIINKDTVEFIDMTNSWNGYSKLFREMKK